MVRSMTHPAAETERDLAKVEMQFPVFAALLHGYLAAADFLTPAEKNEFVALKRIIKDQNKGIVSADLALILSVEPGDTLDAIGEYCYRAWVMKADDARDQGAVPCGLLHGGSVTKPITKGQLITRDAISIPAGSKIAELRARQDKLVYGQ